MGILPYMRTFNLPLEKGLSIKRAAREGQYSRHRTVKHQMLKELKGQHVPLYSQQDFDIQCSCLLPPQKQLPKNANRKKI